MLTDLQHQVRSIVAGLPEGAAVALAGRAEARDYIDFRALAERFTLTELCDLATAKDAGFTPSLLAEALNYIDERDRDTFDLDDEAHKELVAFAKTTARQLKRPEHGRG